MIELLALSVKAESPTGQSRCVYWDEVFYVGGVGHSMP